MKRLLIGLLVLAAFGSTLQARPEPTRFAGPALKLSWRPYQKLPNIPGNIEEVAMTVDPAGVAHFAVLSLHDALGEQAYELRYFNTRYESRSSAAGFSVPYLIDRARVNNQESLQGIDIKAGPNGDTHLVWIHGYVNGDRVAHVRFSSGGDQGSLHWLTSDPVAGEYHATPQVQSTPDGVVHVLVTHASVNFPPFTRLEHLLATSGLAWVSTINQSVPAGRARWSYWKAGANTYQFYATWNESTTNGPFQNGTDVFFSSGLYTPGQTSVDWNSYGKSELTFTGIDWEPDLAIDKDGGLHFAWGKRPVGLLPRPNPSVWYAYNGAARQVSIERVGDPPFPIDSGIRVRTSTNSYVHVFYGGFAHAWAQIGSGDWAQEEPIPAPNDQKLRQDHQADNSKPIPSSPLSVAEFNGRFDLVDTNFYIRTYESIPDGTSYVAAFPGAQVNIVPLSGRFHYKLNLFATKGVGPCQSLALTYNTKESILSLTGPGWTMDHLMYVTVGGDEDNITLTLPSGLDINFSSTGAITDNGFGFVAAIQKLGATWKVTSDGGTEYVFNSFGKLGTVQDPTGNKLEVHYYDSGPNTGMPSEIVDMLGNGGPGRKTQLIYGTGIDASRVVEIIDPGLSHYQLNYSFTTIGRQLASVVFLGVPEHPTYAFTYGTNSLMDQVITPRGNVYKIFYDAAGRVEHTEDPSENIFIDGQDDLSAVSTHTAVQQYVYNDPNDATLIGAGKFHTRVIDRRANPTIHVFDAANKFGVTEIWDATALRDATLPPGEHRMHPMLRTFDAFGNVLTLQDREGVKTTYTYAQIPAAPWLVNLLASVMKSHPSLDAEQLIEEFTYTNDRFGNIRTHTTYVGGVGRTVTYDYDEAGRLTTTHFPNVVRPDGVRQEGITTTNVYGGPRLQLSQVINEEGHVTDYSIGGYHSITGLSLAMLREGGTQPELMGYDDMGHLIRTKAPQGGPGNAPPDFTEYGLDGLYRVVTVKDPAGHTTIHGYDLDSHLVSVLPPAGDATTTVYDKRGYIATITSPDGTWSQFVDGNGNVRRMSTIRGFLTSTFSHMDFDIINRMTSRRMPGASTLSGGGGGGPTVEIRWLRDGFDATTEQHFMLEIQPSPSGDRVTKTLYDRRDRAIRVIAPDQKTVTENVYDERDRIIAVQTLYDGVFQSATLTFRDARDRVERVRVQDMPYGQAPTRVSDRVTILNAAGSVTAAVDPLGAASVAGYSHKTTNLLDARERVQFVIDGNGEISKENIWGDDDLLVEVRVPDPETKSRSLVTSEMRTYSARKELLTLKNRNGVGLTYTYNAIEGQVDTVVDALGRITKTTYYPATQRVDEVVVAYQTPKERRTKSVWAGGLLAETRVFNPGTSSFDASYRYYYDQADRLERFEAPQVVPERHKYNEFGEQYQLLAGSKTITNVYNSLGQRTSSTWTDAYSQVETRTYSGIGLPETITSGPTIDNPSFSVTKLYDAWLGTLAAEVLSVNGSSWVSQSHFSDEAKNYRFFTDSAGGEHEWRYDANNRLTEVRYGSKLVCELFYTVGGLLDRSILHDASNNLSNVISETVHIYDVLGRKARQTTSTKTGETIADFEWDYDALDEVTTIKVNHLGVRSELSYNERREVVREEWTGNNSGQSAPPDGTVIQNLPSVTESDPSTVAQGVIHQTLGVASVVKSYTFDPAGNRTLTTVAGVDTINDYNSASQLISETSASRTVSHYYDEWGNESSRTTTPAGGGTVVHESFTYNYLNLLSDYAKDSAAIHEQYDYWPTGERYSKINMVGVPVQEIYVPRAGDVATEYVNPSTLKNTYLQGSGVDQKYTRIAANGDRRHYLGDAIGTVSVTLTDAGAPSDVSLKDIWGVQLGGGTNERYGFAQREHDSESGLVHMRARMYDPSIGRFTQTDPILGNRPFEHYAYATNNPVSVVDPSGLYGHHIIPQELWKAADNISPEAKKIFDYTIDAAGHNYSKHPGYTRIVRQHLDKYMEGKALMTGEDAWKFVGIVTKDEKVILFNRAVFGAGKGVEAVEAGCRAKGIKLTSRWKQAVYGHFLTKALGAVAITLSMAAVLNAEEGKELEVALNEVKSNLGADLVESGVESATRPVKEWWDQNKDKYRNAQEAASKDSWLEARAKWMGERARQPQAQKPPSDDAAKQKQAEKDLEEDRVRGVPEEWLRKRREKALKDREEFEKQ